MPFEKKVSVCINAYNCQDYIAETLQSVIDQTYDNLEIILVDDCSTDNTVSVVEGFTDSRIKLIRLPENVNISAANNEALRNATGDYIAHLDSDDVWEPAKLEKQIKFIEEHPEYQACFSHVKVINEKSEPVEKGSYFEKVFNIDTVSQVDFIRLFNDTANHLCHSTMLITRKAFEKLGYHDLSLLYLHDYDCWTRLIFITPIFIYPEPLTRYRVRSGSNSSQTDEKDIAHNEEYARVTYNLINNCPDDMFLRAFSDRLKLEGEHTHEETEVEKAFVLLNSFIVLQGNTYLGIKKFDELFKDGKYIKLCKEKFNFSLKDFYALHTKEIFYNGPKTEQMKNEIIGLNGRVDELSGENARLGTELSETQNELLGTQASLAQTRSELESTVQDKDNLERQYRALDSGYRHLEDMYNLALNSRSMRYTQPIRVLRKLKNLFVKTTNDGRKAKAKLVLYGFYGHNLGDDIFFDMLFKRYPDILFYVLCTPDYAPVFGKYANVRFYDCTRPAVQKINALGKKLGIRDLFEWLLLDATDGAVHIGGSVYQQIADWELDLKIRKDRHHLGKKFFAISNNFGPYSTEDYYKFWYRQFKKWDDICFRDYYSYNLFNGIPHVRVAPDLLFSYPHAPCESKKKVAVSVINPRFRVRSFTEEQSAAYEKKIAELIEFYAGRGYEISLLGFCTLEEDQTEIEIIKQMLSDETSEKVVSTVFADSIDAVINEIRESEIVIATRFHAMILGYIFGKDVLPICYGDKMSNVVRDFVLSAETIKMTELGRYSVQELDILRNSLGAEQIAHLSARASEQFAGLDRYAEKKHCEIIR
ncbi:MAG: glycosyltransferase [Ruminococcaceae bacterium]|nr:glycosyltransferase [Oscillospiraceae bacterium]